MNRVRRALILSTIGRHFGLVANFVTLVVVSRVLTPGEIGIAVTASAVISIAAGIREFSSISFIVQRPTVERKDIQGAFFVMLVLTAVTSIGLVLSAHWIAAAYHEPRVSLILQMAALSFVVELPTGPITALLYRDMAFGPVTKINVANASVTAAVTIILVFAGFSYMSFAWGWLSGAAAGTALALFMGGKLWMFKPTIVNLRGMIVFGTCNGLIATLYHIYNRIPYLVIGRVLSLDAVALFNRAMTLCQLPDKAFLGGAEAVMLPAFADEVRNGRDLKRAFFAASSYATGLLWPALIALAILAHPIVLIALGHQWLAAVPLVRIIAVSSLLSYAFDLTYPILVATGSIRSALLRSAIAWPISLAIISAAVNFGLTAAALSLIVAIPFQAVVSLVLVRKQVPMGWGEIALSLWKSAAITGCSAVGPLMIVLVNGTLAIGIVAFVEAAVLCGLGWAAGIWVFRHPLRHEVEQFATWLNRLRPSRNRREIDVGPALRPQAIEIKLDEQIAGQGSESR